MDKEIINKGILIESLKYKKTGDVLDLGAGNGFDSLFYAKNKFKVTAIDNFKQNIHDIKQLAKINEININAILLDVKELNLKKKYDIILGNFIFQYLNEKEAIILIKKMKGNTKKTGLNIITGFTKENSLKDYEFLFDKQELKSFYEDWEILYYKEYCSPILPHLTIKPKSIVEIIAKKR